MEKMENGIDMKKGEIIGLILSGGNVWKSGTLQFVNKDVSLIRKFYGLVEEVYGFKGKVRRSRSEFTGGSVIQLLYSVNLTRILFNEFGEFLVNGKKVITEDMLKMSRDFKMGLIRGLWESSSISKNRLRKDLRQVSISLKQRDKELLEKMGLILSEFGIKWKIYHEGDYWYLHVTRSEDCINFINLIGIEFVPEQMRSFAMMLRARTGNGTTPSMQVKDEYYE